MYSDYLVIAYALLGVALSIISVKSVSWCLNLRKMWKLASKMQPSPLKYIPLIGHWLDIRGNGEKILKLHLNLAKYQQPMPVWLGPVLVVLISNAKDVEKVFNSPYALTKSKFYKLADSILADGILLTSGSKWKLQKKKILPMFHPKNMEIYFSTIVKHANALLSVLETKTGEIDCEDVIYSCSYDTFCENAMGFESNAQTSHFELSTNLKRASEIFFARLFTLWLQPEIVYRLTPLYFEQCRISKRIQEIVQGAVAKMEETMKSKTGFNVNCPIEKEKATKKIFLEYLLETRGDGDELSNREIADQIVTILEAGVDTSSVAICFTLLTIAMYPDVQQKVFEEAIEVLGEEEPEVTDLKKLVYLKMVVNETMRLFPVAAFVGRYAEEDIELETCTIPKGAEIDINIIGIHRNPIYFKDPLKFDPERFSPEEEAKRHYYSYLPFTAGIRQCIAVKYAYMFMLALLSKIVTRFEIETPYKSVEEIKLGVPVKPLDGYLIRFKLRNSGLYSNT